MPGSLGCRRRWWRRSGRRSTGSTNSAHSRTDAARRALSEARTRGASWIIRPRTGPPPPCYSGVSAAEDEMLFHEDAGSGARPRPGLSQDTPYDDRCDTDCRHPGGGRDLRIEGGICRPQPRQPMPGVCEDEFREIVKRSHASCAVKDRPRGGIKSLTHHH
jgi:hypothetical protein